MAFPKSLVIVPTYNEKENILLIMSAILEQNECLEILVVDDGSPDGTGDLIQAEADKNPRIHLLRRKGKMGLGSAYVMGFKWALERDYERVFEMDADFSHAPTDLNRFLETAENADLVLGSRYQDHRISVVNWDLRRLILSEHILIELGNRLSSILGIAPPADVLHGFTHEIADLEGNYLVCTVLNNLVVDLLADLLNTVKDRLLAPVIVVKVLYLSAVRSMDNHSTSQNVKHVLVRYLVNVGINDLPTEQFHYSTSPQIDFLQ